MAFVIIVKLNTCVLAHMEGVPSFSKRHFNEIDLLLLVSGSLAHEHDNLNAKASLAGPAGRKTITRNNYTEQLCAVAVDT